MTDSRDRLLVAEMKPVVFFYYPPPRWIPFAPTDSLLFPPHFRQLAPLAPAAGVQPPFYRVSTEFCGAVATLRGTRNATWGHPIFFFASLLPTNGPFTRAHPQRQLRFMEKRARPPSSLGSTGGDGGLMKPSDNTAWTTQQA